MQLSFLKLTIIVLVCLLPVLQVVDHYSRKAEWLAVSVDEVCGTTA